jgi:hypothetical protein
VSIVIRHWIYRPAFALIDPQAHGLVRLTQWSHRLVSGLSGNGGPRWDEWD